MTVVVDASAIVSLLTRDEKAPRVQTLLDEHDALPWTLALLDAEVGHALRGLVRGGKLPARVAEARLHTFRRMGFVRTGLRDHMQVAWSLRHNLSFYDALYVALAARIGAPLLALDARIAAVPGLPAEVIVA